MKRKAEALLNPKLIGLIQSLHFEKNQLQTQFLCEWSLISKFEEEKDMISQDQMGNQEPKIEMFLAAL